MELFEFQGQLEEVFESLFPEILGGRVSREEVRLRGKGKAHHFSRLRAAPDRLPKEVEVVVASPRDEVGSVLQSYLVEGHMSTVLELVDVPADADAF